MHTAAAAVGAFVLLQDLIQKLLERKPAKRLGMLSGKAQDVKRHRWFEGMDWAALEARRSAPPRRPKVRRC
jgi:cGMP-dependent protein kinase 2